MNCPKRSHAAPARRAVLVDCLTLWLSNIDARHDSRSTRVTRRLEEALWPRASGRPCWSRTRSASASCRTTRSPALSRRARRAQPAHRGRCRPRGVHGRRPAAECERIVMTESGRRQGRRTPPRQDGEAQSRAGRRSRRRRRSRRACSSSTPAPGKGKSTAAFGLALRMLGHGWRVGVVQFIKGAWHTGETRRAGSVSAIRSPGTPWAKASPGRRRIKTRDIAAAERAWAKAKELMADPSFGLVDPRRTQHRAALRLSAARRCVADAEAPAARSARRRHRPQRQAGTDRGRRPRHRMGAGEAPLRGRREGAAGHRVLTWRRAR